MNAVRGYDPDLSAVRPIRLAADYRRFVGEAGRITP